jgi:hypothetical protein
MITKNDRKNLVEIIKNQKNLDDILTDIYSTSIGRARIIAMDPFNLSCVQKNDFERKVIRKSIIQKKYYLINNSNNLIESVLEDFYGAKKIKYDFEKKHANSYLEKYQLLVHKYDGGFDFFSQDKINLELLNSLSMSDIDFYAMREFKRLKSIIPKYDSDIKSNHPNINFLTELMSIPTDVDIYVPNYDVSMCGVMRKIKTEERVNNKIIRKIFKSYFDESSNSKKNKLNRNNYKNILKLDNSVINDDVGVMFVVPKSDVHNLVDYFKNNDSYIIISDTFDNYYEDSSGAYNAVHFNVALNNDCIDLNYVDKSDLDSIEIIISDPISSLSSNFGHNSYYRRHKKQDNFEIVSKELSSRGLVSKTLSKGEKDILKIIDRNIQKNYF